MNYKKPQQSLQQGRASCAQAQSDRGVHAEKVAPPRPCPEPDLPPAPLPPPWSAFSQAWSTELCAPAPRLSAEVVLPLVLRDTRVQPVQRHCGWTSCFTKHSHPRPGVSPPCLSVRLSRPLVILVAHGLSQPGCGSLLWLWL